MSYLEETDCAPSALRTRLELATKEKLIELIVRLAADSEESAARIDYLTDPGEAVKMLQRRISSIRNGKRFVNYGESGDLAAQIATIAADIRADLLLTEPEKAKILAEKLFTLDHDTTPSSYLRRYVRFKWGPLHVSTRWLSSARALIPVC
jgi:hypothetical protein